MAVTGSESIATALIILTYQCGAAEPRSAENRAENGPAVPVKSSCQGGQGAAVAPRVTRVLPGVSGVLPEYTSVRSNQLSPLGREEVTGPAAGLRYRRVEVSPIQ
ncbi:hypothetical protein Bbelb_360120 [Branchiostoma belcheri]|nr:hypothetical protein Bbelb_360120 [Branchiostoma belcheri]